MEGLGAHSPVLANIVNICHELPDLSKISHDLSSVIEKLGQLRNEVYGLEMLIKQCESELLMLDQNSWLRFDTFFNLDSK